MEEFMATEAQQGHFILGQVMLKSQLAWVPDARDQCETPEFLPLGYAGMIFMGYQWIFSWIFHRYFTNISWVLYVTDISPIFHWIFCNSNGYERILMDIQRMFIDVWS